MNLDSFKTDQSVTTFPFHCRRRRWRLNRRILHLKSTTLVISLLSIELMLRNASDYNPISVFFLSKTCILQHLIYHYRPTGDVRPSRPPRKSAAALTSQIRTSTASAGLLEWAQKCTADRGVEIKDFGPSWQDGRCGIRSESLMRQLYHEPPLL